MLPLVCFTLSAVLAALCSGEPVADKGGNCAPQGPTALQPATCCPVTLLSEDFDKFRSICLQQSPHMKGDHICIYECMFNMKKLLTEKLQVDEDRVRQIFKPNKSIGTNTIDNCLRTRKADLPKYTKCRSGASGFIDCLMREVYLQCPQAVKKTSPECVKLETKYKNCPDLQVVLK